MLAVAVAAPLAAASTDVCIDGAPNVVARSWTSTGDLASNVAEGSTTGWIGSFAGSAGGDATQNVPSITDGFLSWNDNDSSTEVATIVVTTALSVVKQAVLKFDLESLVGFGFPGGQDESSRQSVIVDVINPNGEVETLRKLSVAHFDKPAIKPSDAEMTANGYILQGAWLGKQTYPLSFEATSTGTATIRYTFTIQPKIGANRSDDIALGIPLTATQFCAG